MIPKTIHYCWFGGKPMPKPVKKCMKSWKKYCPDYQLVRWDEKTFDLSTAPRYVQQAYQAKKWAFVTDYVRLQVIYEFGGIYLDTDVEVIRNLDKLLHNQVYFGFETDCAVNTGHGFGAEKGAPILREFLQDYEDRSFYLADGTMDLTPCPERNTAVLSAHGLVLNGEEQILDGGIHVYPRSFFCPKDFESGEILCTGETCSIHHFDASWHTGFEKFLRRKSRAYQRQYGKEEGARQMDRWKKRHRVLMVLMTEGPGAAAAKARKKLLGR